MPVPHVPYIKTPAEMAAVALGGVATTALLARQMNLDNGPLVFLVALMSSIAAASVVGLALPFLRRSWRLVAIAFAISVLCGLTQVRVFTPTPSESGSAYPVVLMTLSMSADAHVPQLMGT